MSWAELSKLAPALPWMLLRDTAEAPQALNVKSPAYTEAMGQQFRAASLPTLQTYVQWQVLRSLGPLPNTPRSC